MENRILVAFGDFKFENEFVDRLCEILSQKHSVVRSIDEFWNAEASYDFIIINWPETLFKKPWKQVDKSDLTAVADVFKRWRSSGTKLIIIRHNIYRHRSESDLNNTFYDFAYRNVDAVVHLGEFSLGDYKKRYHASVFHAVIPHPLFSRFNLSMPKIEARKMLNIDNKTFLCVIPGWTRHKHEVDRATAIFDMIDAKKKRLDFLNVQRAFPRYKRSDYRFYLQLLEEKLVAWVKKIHYHKSVISDEMMSVYFSAADIIIIPRIEVLNSGNVTLGAQFGKLVIGPGTGNIKEDLERLDQIVFGHNGISIAHKELNDAIRARLTAQFSEKLKRAIKETNSDNNILAVFNELFYTLKTG